MQEGVSFELKATKQCMTGILRPKSCLRDEITHCPRILNSKCPVSMRFANDRQVLLEPRYRLACEDDEMHGALNQDDKKTKRKKDKKKKRQKDDEMQGALNREGEIAV